MSHIGCFPTRWWFAKGIVSQPDNCCALSVQLLACAMEPCMGSMSDATTAVCHMAVHDACSMTVIYSKVIWARLKAVLSFRPAVTTRDTSGK